MTIIQKKVQKKYFEQVLKGKKNWEFRLNDFKIKEGDILELLEVGKNKKPTGRKLRKKVRNVIKFKPTDFYKLDKMKKKGVQIITF